MQDAVVGNFDYLQLATVLTFPSTCERRPAPGDVSSQNRADFERELLVAVLDKVGKLALNLFVNDHRGGNLSCAVAQGAFLRGVDFRDRTNPLAGNLHKPEFGERQHVVLCAVG